MEAASTTIVQSLALDGADSAPAVRQRPFARAVTTDVDKADGTAAAALDQWQRLGASERGRLLLKRADKINANMEELARLESLDTGHPLRDLV